MGRDSFRELRGFARERLDAPFRQTSPATVRVRPTTQERSRAMPTSKGRPQAEEIRCWNRAPEPGSYSEVGIRYLGSEQAKLNQRLTTNSQCPVLSHPARQAVLTSRKLALAVSQRGGEEWPGAAGRPRPRCRFPPMSPRARP